MTSAQEGDGAWMIDAYRTMRLIREFEARVRELMLHGELRGTAHLGAGQEAVAVGVGHALGDGDAIVSTHRPHGHVIAKGVGILAVFAELLGREEGTNRGCGGSMHLMDCSAGVYGATGIVGSMAPVACGLAQAIASRGEAGVIVCFLGEGAMNQGVVLEALNLAAIWSLPVLFVCENNGYAVTTPVESVVSRSLCERVGAFGVRSEAVDGMDVRAVWAAASKQIRRTRGGGGPAFLECRTYRYSGHFVGEEGLQIQYRTPGELEDWLARDPLERCYRQLVAAGCWSPQDRARTDADVRREVEDALAQAREAPWPAADAALELAFAAPYDGAPAAGAWG